MILVQKPQPALSSPLNMSVPHRRQSSAPIVVQPTRIPGLLSLSKPPRSTPPRHQQRHVIKNAPKQQTASFTSPSLVRAHPQPAYTAPVTPSPHFRGRPQEKHPKDKIPHNKRIASQSSLHGISAGKHNGRQPSPPILSTIMTSHHQKSSQAEAPVNSSNHFDPFVDHSTPTPSPSSRKQPQSKAIPVPTASNQRTTTLARSDPLPTHINRRQQQRSSLISKRATREFPICDDMSEIADPEDEPSTPIARRLYEGAPLRSAPISTGTFRPISFPVPLSSPSPQNKKNGDRSRNKKHRRTPSEGGVFHMSSDEEAPSVPGAMLNGNLSSNMKGLFNPSASRPTEMNITTPSRPGVRAGVADRSTMNMTSIEKAAFFASSLFQNSPSPDELPDPLLL